jgi:hypothetical protein
MHKMSSRHGLPYVHVGALKCGVLAGNKGPHVPSMRTLFWVQPSAQQHVCLQCLLRVLAGGSHQHTAEQQHEQGLPSFWAGAAAGWLAHVCLMLATGRGLWGQGKVDIVA